MVLRTERLLLRPFTVHDVAAVHRYASDPEVTVHMTWGPNTDEETLAFVRQAAVAGQGDQPSAIELAIEEIGVPGPIGGAGLYRRDAVRREFEIGYCLRRDRWRQGIMTEAVRELVRCAFEDLGVHRLVGLVAPENVASARVLRKAGMTHEGRLRGYLFAKGKWWDFDLYAMLSTDPR